MVVLIQLLVITAGDSRFTSSTDAGGRGASIGAAAENGGCDHDLGYWAEKVDPAGEVHPMINSTVKGGRYVQPTSLVLACTGGAAVAAFGQPFSLLPSVVGVVMASLGAWMLAKAIGGTGWVALFATAFGPVAFFGADTWEHAPATGAAILGTALFFRRSSFASGVIAGALWGLAISMRIEVSIVALGLAVAVLCVSEARTLTLRRPLRVAGLAIGGVVSITVDRVVERAVLGDDIRATRAVGGGGGGAGGQLSQFGSDLEQRGRDAWVTTIGLLSNDRTLDAFLVGGGYVVAVVIVSLGVVGIVRWNALHVGAFVIVAVCLVGRIVVEGFIPGMFVAAPLAATGVVYAMAHRAEAPPLARAIVFGGVLALPVVWLSGWPGLHQGQWGGRYQLTTTALLVVVGSTLVERRSRNRLARGLVAVTLAVGMVGLAWHVERTQRYGQTFEALRSTPCDGVLVSASVFLLREGGALDDVREQRVGECRLLSASPDEIGDALEVAHELGEDRGLVVHQRRLTPDPDDYGDWVIDSSSATSLGALDVTLVWLHRP